MNHDQINSLKKKRKNEQTNKQNINLDWWIIWWILKINFYRFFIDRSAAATIVKTLLCREKRKLNLNRLDLIKMATENKIKKY